MWRGQGEGCRIGEQEGEGGCMVMCAPPPTPTLAHGPAACVPNLLLPLHTHNRNSLDPHPHEHCLFASIPLVPVSPAPRTPVFHQLNSLASHTPTRNPPCPHLVGLPQLLEHPGGVRVVFVLVGVPLPRQQVVLALDGGAIRGTLHLGRVGQRGGQGEAEGGWDKGKGLENRGGGWPGGQAAKGGDGWFGLLFAQGARTIPEQAVLQSALWAGAGTSAVPACPRPHRVPTPDARSCLR